VGSWQAADAKPMGSWKTADARGAIFNHLMTDSLGTVRRWRENGITLEVRS
jgi:hypothetical protein